MRYLLTILLALFIFSSVSPAESTNVQVSKTSSNLNNLFRQSFQTSSLHFSLYSYKPKLGDLTTILQSVGIPKTPVALMPTFSIVLQHRAEFDSRLEIGYWRTQLETPAPNSLVLTTTLIPISYQFIYRPILLYDYLPMYIGVGVGFLRVNFDGNITDVLAEQGITLGNTASSTTGYVIIGVDLFRWQSQPGAAAAIGNNASINFELKRILKTVETTGDRPLNIILDGTAIGLGVRTQF